MRIYISGPMTGKPDLNEPLFRSTEERLREMGHEVFNPHNVQKQPSYRDYLANDLAWICERADALVVLPGWEDSPGSKAEVAVADCIDLPIYEAAEGGFFRKHVWVAIVDEPYGDERLEAVA